MKYSMLFSPVKIGTITVKNRLVVPSMGTHFSNPDGTVSQRFFDYWLARARGGFGMLNIEITSVDALGVTIPNQPGIWDDRFIPGYKSLTDEVHKYGAKMTLQLAHAGRAAKSAMIGVQPVAPSAVPAVMEQEVPRELTTAEVYAIVEKFGDAARRAKIAGFDAVEVHGAHVYLIAQFMSASSNKRTDEFGGSFRNRMLFPVEIIKNIRLKVGDFPVIFRISADERTVGGRTIEGSCAAAQVMEEAGVDAIHVSTGFATPPWTVAPAAVPMAFLSSHAEAIKKSVHIPVIAVGRIHEPELAENMLATGKADLIAMGRQSLADPEFPNKVAEGAFQEIAPCIGCNQGCLGSLFKADPGGVTCLVNPFCGNEGTWNIEPAREPKKIMVVGGGPAGLEAAWVAARRGHAVTLYEKSENLGGLYRIAAVPPTKQDIARAINYFTNMGNKYGVKFMMGQEVTPELVRETNPDAVILATGSEPCRPKIKGIEGKNIMLAGDILSGKKWPGKSVCIAGAGMVGAEVADFLCGYNRDITLVDMLPDIAMEEQASTRYFLTERLSGFRVKVILNACIKEFLSDGLVYEKDGKEEKCTGFDTTVLALGYQAYNPLETQLRDIVKEVHVIGDAVKARKALEAVAEGAQVALKI